MTGESDTIRFLPHGRSVSFRRGRFPRAGVLAAVVILGFCGSAPGRARPPPVPMDRLLKRAEVIVLGQIDRRTHALIVTKVIKGQVKGDRVKVRFGSSFPAVAFPRTETHPAQFLLTGWDGHGHISKRRRGLDLYKDRVWFLERKEGLSANSISSLQPAEFAPLIELMARRAGTKENRAMIKNRLGGQIPAIVVEYFNSSDDPGAGALAYEAMVEGSVSARVAFRTINSLGGNRTLRYCRRALKSESDRTRRYALAGMMKYRDRQSVPQIVALLRSGRMRHPAKAIEALGVIGDPRAVSALVEVMHRPDPQKPGTMYLWEHARAALRRITHVWLSPNEGKAAAWWKRNKHRPPSHWLKQGIEQDLCTIQRYHTHYFVAEYRPRDHLAQEACRQLVPPNIRSEAEDAGAARACRDWWQKNKHLPQERWVMDSFAEIGQPIEDLQGAQLVEKLIEMLNARLDRAGRNRPALGILHTYWADRLLARLTGLRVANPEYAHYTGPIMDTKVYGPQWKRAWAKHKAKVKIQPLRVPKPERFVFEDADRRGLLSDFDTWQVRVTLKPPLVPGRYVVAHLEITLTNTAKRPLRISTAPRLGNINGYAYGGSGGGSATRQFQCVSHKGEFATVPPGEWIRWEMKQSLHYWGRDGRTWLMFRLVFGRGGKGLRAWRGVVRTPWISIERSRELTTSRARPGRLHPL